MLFKVTNTSRGMRFVPTLAGRSPVTPGEKNARNLDMDPEVARQYRAMAARSEKFSIQIAGTNDESREALQQAPQARKRSKLPPDYKKPAPLFNDPPKSEPEQESPYDSLGDSNIDDEGQDEGDAANPPQTDDSAKGRTSKKGSKAELLARADDMELADLRTEARMVLGKDWPKGKKLNKRAIKALLSE